MAKNSNDMAKAGAAALAAAAVAAAGAYWFYGAKDAAKHRKSAKSWMLRARAEVLEATEKIVERVGEIDKKTYLDIVDRVIKQYTGVAGVTSAEVAQMAKDLKGAWVHMQKAGKQAGKAKGITKKAVKKVKKATKKKR